MRPLLSTCAVQHTCVGVVATFWWRWFDPSRRAHHFDHIQTDRFAHNHRLGATRVVVLADENDHLVLDEDLKRRRRQLELLWLQQQVHLRNRDGRGRGLVLCAPRLLIRRLLGNDHGALALRRHCVAEKSALFEKIFVGGL